MVLASALSGDCSEEGPRPTACGVACMLYTGLREDDYAQISEALGIWDVLVLGEAEITHGILYFQIA